MKYRRLSGKQLEALHEDFSKFLVLRKINIEEWENLKRTHPEAAEQEINAFSDRVWENILQKVRYLEHISPHTINLFKCNKTDVERVVIQSEVKNFSSKENIEWILNNLHSNTLKIMRGARNYTQQRNTELFNLIEKGAEFSKGELFELISISQK